MYANNAGTGYANANIFYLFLGAQPQWGNLWAGYTEVLNWYFPLTTSQVYAVCLTKHTKNISSGHNWEPARIEEWNNSYARIHPDGDLGYSVIAICKAQQQWGYQKQLTVEPVVYPLPVNTVCCVWAHSIHDRQDPGTYHSILSKITPVGVQILAVQYNAPATAYSGISAYWGMIGC